MKLDREHIGTVEKIIEILKKELKPTGLKPTKRHRFRGSGITLAGFSDLDIDISIDQRRSTDFYSSEACLNDRYESIRRQYPDCYQMVLANVVKAKQFLKEKGVYKTDQGGMGGIGIENWILQNGGSFRLAAQDFVNHAYVDGELVNFEQFKSIYHVFDFGCNHEPKFKFKTPYFPRCDIYYAYDNYIADNLSEKQYKLMAQVLKDYVSQDVKKRSV